jgi:hypothetical protein
MIKLNEIINGAIEVIHITLPEIAEKIEKDGLNPKSFLLYNYYSSMGKNGIYFYEHARQAQEYAFFLNNKVHKNGEKVAIIYCIIPINFFKKTDSLEDGLFVPTEYLKHIIVERIELVFPQDIYR